MMRKWLFVLFSLSFVELQQVPGPFLGQEWRCPEHWIEFQGSCYRFVKSPIRSRDFARENCRIYSADLVSINSLEEHGFIVETLQGIDPQKRKWYTGAVRQGGFWVNEIDNSPLSNLDLAFLPQSPPIYSYRPRDFIAYSYSIPLGRWGFEEVTGEDKLLYICKAPITNLLHLLMEDRSFSYGVDVADVRYIPRGPKFIKEPQDVVFDLSKRRINNDVSMSCLASGFPAPTYEWFKEKFVNDRLIEEPIDPLQDYRVTVSGGILIINNPDEINDRGSYHCKATNKYGSIVSESASLSFGFIGEFNLKRSPESGNRNWGKAIFCDPPQHSPGVSYYWNRDFFPNFVDEDQRVFSSHDGALYFSALGTLDAARYSCSVKSKVSDMGRNGPFFPLDVLEHPNYQQLKFPNNFPKVFPEAPIAGQEARLECVAFGYPVPSYNWTRVNSTIPRGAIYSSYNRVLTIPRAQVEDQGEYICRASNDRAAITQGVYLTIQAEPNFTIPLTDKHMNIRSSLTWTCEAFGIPDVTYTWFKNGVELIPRLLYPGDAERYRIQDNVLDIQNLDPVRDEAMYQCRATNQMKTRYSAAQLRVLALKPSFKKTPLEAETYAAEGGNVTIFCNPEAAPSPKFSWKKNGALLGSGGRRLIMNNGNLVINRVSRDDAGLYSCTAENDYGRDESFGHLIVLGGPHFVEVMKPLFVAKIGANVALYCNAVSDDMLDVAYIWTHNGIRIREDHAGHARMRVDTGVLSIQNATYAESGDYECIVKSAVGRIATRTQVIIEGPPGPPGGVQVAEVKKTSAKVQWTDGASNGRPILFYAIFARTAGNSTWMRLVRDVRAIEIDRYYGRKQFELEGLLSPYCAYEFTIAAANSIGYGPESAPSPQYHTPPDRPYRAPYRISGGGGKIGDLTITWEPLSYVDLNGPGLYYKVFWRKTREETEFQSEVLKDYGNINQAVVQVPKDNFYTQYDVKVQAINDVGFGPESEVHTIYSAEDMPQVAPQEVSARSYNSTALNVTWLPISQSRETVRGKLIGYRIKYWVKDREETQATYYLSRSTKPWAIVVGLMPDTYYFVKVLAYNSAGEGPESERFIERTYLKAAQTPPAAVTLEGVNPTTIRVTWRSVTPSQDEEPILGYKVRVWEQDRDMNTAKDTFLPRGQNLEAYITNLNPVKTYNLRVLAFSNGGDGRMSSPVQMFRLADPAHYRLNGATRGAVISHLTIILVISIIFSKIML